MSATSPNELITSAVALYRARLNVGRDEARRWLDLLSNHHLAEHIAQTRRELAEVREEDLAEPLAHVLGELGIDPNRLGIEKRSALLRALAEEIHTEPSCRCYLRE